MTNKLSRIYFIIRSGLLAGGVTVAPSVFASTPGKFKVGAVLELSGADATGGQVAKRGYELWATTVNAAGGIKIGGSMYKVELVVQDCQSQPAQGATACERLVRSEEHTSELQSLMRISY